MIPANVSGWTATRILMDTATSLRLTAARTTSTASVIATTRRHTPTPRAATLAEFFSTDIAMVITTWLWESNCCNRRQYAVGSYICDVDETHCNGYHYRPPDHVIGVPVLLLFLYFPPSEILKLLHCSLQALQSCTSYRLNTCWYIGNGAR